MGMANRNNHTARFRKRIAVETSIALAVLIPLAAGFILLRHCVAEAANRMVETKRAFASHTEIIDKLVLLRSQYNEFGKPYLSVLHNVVPEKDELIDISQEFQRIASANNLDFGFSFRGEDPASKTGLGAIHFSTTVSGKNLDEIVSYIQDLQNFKYLTTIQSTHTARVGERIESIVIGKVHYRL